MNRLVLAFGIVCLLQGLSAEPKPEFGLANSIPASSKLGTVKSDVVSINNEIKALTVDALVSGMTKLETTKTNIETVITEYDNKAKAIITAYESLVAATDGNINAAFTPFLTKIDEALAYINGDGANVVKAIADLDYTGISDELTDAFKRINDGLTDLKAKTEDVKTGILAAMNASLTPNVNADILRQHVTLKRMYNLLMSATKVRTYLPLVKYILQTTISNLSVADKFVKDLKDALNTDVSTISDKFTDEIKKITDSIEASVSGDFGDYNTEVVQISEDIDSMTGILGKPKTTELKATITTMSGLFSSDALGAGTTAMGSAFAAIRTALSGKITTLKNAASVTDNALVNKLIDTLVGNDEYGRYCYYKYKDLVEGLFDMSFDGGWLCVDKEYARLEHLQVTLGLIIDLIAVDFQDVKTEVDVCNQLGDTSNSYASECVAALATYYANLFGATKKKIDLVYTIASDEAAASQNRLLICFELVNLDTSITQVATITDGLTICAKDGPNGTD